MFERKQDKDKLNELLHALGSEGKYYDVAILEALEELIQARKDIAFNKFLIENSSQHKGSYV